MAESREQTEGGTLDRAQFLVRSASFLGLLVVGGELAGPALAESNRQPTAAELISRTDTRWSKMLREITDLHTAGNPKVKDTPFTAVRGGIVHQYAIANTKPAADGLYYALTIITPQSQLGQRETVGPDTLITTFIDQTDNPKLKSKLDNRYELSRYPASASEAYAIIFGSHNILINADGGVGFLSPGGNQLAGQDKSHKTLEPSLKAAGRYLESYMDMAEHIVKTAKTR